MRINTVIKKLHRMETAIVAGVVLMVAVMTDTFITKEINKENKEVKENICEDQEPETEIIESDKINLVFDSMKATKLENTEFVKTLAASDNETETETTAAPAWIISCNTEDYNNLVRIVEAEATGGDIKSKILVANVVINRVKSSDFPNTITDVIYQGDGEQFQPIQDGRFYSVQIQPSSIEASERALSGEDYSKGAQYFSSVDGGWHARKLKRLFNYGGHTFFTR